MPSITSQSTGGQDDGSNSPTDSDQYEDEEETLENGEEKEIEYVLNYNLCNVAKWLLDNSILMTNPVAAFSQFGCVSGLLVWITRENVNYVIMVKRLGSDYDS